MFFHLKFVNFVFDFTDGASPKVRRVIDNGTSSLLGSFYDQGQESLSESDTKNKDKDGDAKDKDDVISFKDMFRFHTNEEFRMALLGAFFSFCQGHYTFSFLKIQIL